MERVDSEIAVSLIQLVGCAYNVAGAIAALLITSYGTFILLLIPVIMAYYIVQKLFRASNTEVQRLASITASPIYTDFSQTLNGITTVRAHGLVDSFRTRNAELFNYNNRAIVMQLLTGSWLGQRLDLLGAVLTGFLALFGAATWSFNSDYVNAGWIALGLAYALEMTMFLKHMVNMIATAEAQFNSVERLEYYANNLESEDSRREVKVVPAEGKWPVDGKVVFDDVKMRYRDGLPLALQGVSFEVAPGSTVGIVGRTGSGKSSLLVALCRGREIEGGTISVDGIDVSEIPLSSLRSNISLIPQDPFCFSGTIRFNMDPFNRHDDASIMNALRSAQLEGFVASLEKGLDSEVVEGGSNLSVGQRQLICIARAILRKSKIVLMDEATASVDPETDELIQTMMKTNFSHATVITIAHRINTVMDSDAILVMDKGVAAEFGPPKELLENPDGIFTALVKAHEEGHGETVEAEANEDE